jgi:phage I-like protein
MSDSNVALSREIQGTPAYVQVIPYGRHRTDRGEFVLDEEGARSIMRDFDARVNDLVIDYEHQSLRGDEAPAAGWITHLVDRGREGLWAAVQWTDRARGYLENREYRYLSPVFLVRRRGRRVVRLLNAALTNTPAIDGMVPLVNKQTHPTQDGKEEHMETKDQDEPVTNPEVLHILGLDKGATFAEVTGIVAACKEAHDQLPGLLTEVAGLKRELRRREAAEAVTLAMKEGKVTPALRDWAQAFAEQDPEAFTAFAAKAPVVVPTVQPPATRIQGPAEDELQARVNRSLGITPEAFRTHSNH